jgi:ribosomal protein S18 acetylase RimI-like enzyme
MDQNFLIREYREDDFDAVTILWRVAREKLLPEGETDTGHNFYEDQHYFRDQILKKNQVWVVEIEHRPVAFMAMENDFIDQLYVHPRYHRCGIGKALLAFARGRSREHLWLYTLQSNVNAQAFYENNGFVAERFGMSPENEPDVEYHWRKTQSSI